MSMFNCLVMCAVAVSLSNVYAGENEKPVSDEYVTLKNECLKQYGLTEAGLIAVWKAGDASKINSCYWGCYFKKVGFLNDKGQYDMKNYLTTIKKLVKRDEDFAEMKELAKRCASVKDQAVSDGEAGCERGALLAACFIKYE